MRSAILLAALACLVAGTAFAGRIGPSLSFSCDDPVRFASRHDGSDIRFAITNDSRKVMLLITDHVVAMQLSDRVLHKIDRKIKYAKDEDDEGALGGVIKSAVLTSVRSLLSQSAECDIQDIARADYRDGELILLTRDGDRLFASDDDDENVMEAFSESDARAFVRNLRRRMAAYR